MQLIDPNHPAYRPVWARMLIVAVCFGWALVEAFKGDPFWAVLAGGAGCYSVYMLFWSYKPPAAAEPEAPAAAEEPAAPETPTPKDAD